MAAVKKPSVFPTEALPVGAHAALRTASQHKKQVSAVLHLKKESVGKGNPTAYTRANKQKLAFPKMGAQNV